MKLKIVLRRIHALTLVKRQATSGAERCFALVADALLHLSSGVDLRGAEYFAAAHEDDLVEEVAYRADVVRRHPHDIADLRVRRGRREIEESVLFVGSYECLG
jgi:hypothetical protein